MISQLEIVSRLLLAALLGSIVGIERERLSWAAGLRTHMLVAVGAALVMVVSAFGFADIQNAKNVSLDPSRVAAQVVSGIGFLGAGSIVLRGEIIRGLTTAASLWVVAAVGLAVGGGMYVAAIAATAIVLAILAGLKPIERFFAARRLGRAHPRAPRRGEADVAAGDARHRPGAHRPVHHRAGRRRAGRRPHPRGVFKDDEPRVPGGPSIPADPRRHQKMEESAA